MLAGRFLLASIAVETNGISPFSVKAPSDHWRDELNSFHWLRHFHATKSSSAPEGFQDRHAFLQSLVLDWVGRNGVKQAKNWTPSIVSRRILSWLRHYRLLVEGASPETSALIDNSLQLQVEYLRARAGWIATSIENCYIQMALLGIALSRGLRTDLVDRAAQDLIASLNTAFNTDGSPKSRNPTDLFVILLEVVSLRAALNNTQCQYAEPLSHFVTKMLQMLRLAHHHDGSPIFFNGATPLPVDILLALLSHENTLNQPEQINMPMGYARMAEGPALLMADVSTSPPLIHSRAAHAGLGSFEYSVGSELIVCNVGAAPADYSDLSLGFRLAPAHSGLMINDHSIGDFYSAGSGKKFFALPKFNLKTSLSTQKKTITFNSDAYARKFNIHHTRSLSLLDGGQTLLGRDQLSAASAKSLTKKNQFHIRFHLNGGALVHQSETPNVLAISLRNGERWIFMCEGATIGIEPSIRIAPIHGLQQTFQIVLHGTVTNEHEVVWSFSKAAD